MNKNSFAAKVAGSRPANPVLITDDNMQVHTANGLSMTPADIQRCVQQGIPVSAANLDSFIDGVDNPSTSLPVDELRGVDIVDAWNASRDAKKKLARAHLNDIKTYGV